MASIEQMFKESRDEAKECLENYLDGKCDTEKFQVLIVGHKQQANVMESILQFVTLGVKDGKDCINSIISMIKIDGVTTLFDIATIGITPDEMKGMTDGEFKELLENKAQWMKQELKGLREIIKEMEQAVKQDA